MLRRLIPLGVTAAAAALTILGTTAASATSNSIIIGDPGIYLSSTPTLTLAAPNNITTGKPAVLKTCLGNGDCTIFANDKATETFDFVANTTKIYAPNTIPTGFEIRVHGTNWCVTNRGTAVFFEACGLFASQLWNGSTSTNTTTTAGVLHNQKTQLNLTHTAVAAYAPVAVASQQTHWGNSS